MPAQKGRCLTGRIASSDYGDFLIAAKARFDWRSPVPDTAAFEFFQLRRSGPPVLCTACNDNGHSLYVTALPAPYEECTFATVQSRRLFGNYYLRAEFLSLHIGASGELAARNACRKPKIILNSGA